MVILLLFKKDSSYCSHCMKKNLHILKQDEDIILLKKQKNSFRYFPNANLSDLVSITRALMYER